MQVIAGKYKNYRIKTDKSLRPTSSMVKGAIFNIINHNNFAPSLQSSKIIDLFCGTGALGIEALSRGAEWLVAIDMDTRFVHKNTSKVDELLLIIKGDLSQNPSPMSQIPKTSFDIVFMDPPYSNPELLVKVISKLVSDFRYLLHADTLIIIEMSKSICIQSILEKVTLEQGRKLQYLLIKEKTYNRIRLVVLKIL